MNKLRIGICDDEPGWIQKSQELLSEYETVVFPNKNKILTYDGLPLDAVFMDIELAGENGIEVASLLNKKWPDCLIVYVTNYLFYATDAYTTKHIYFVLKEQFEVRLGAVIEKILEHQKQAEKKWRFDVIGGSSKEVLLSSNDIWYFERDKRRTRIHTGWGIYEIWNKINDLEERFSHKNFVRCHNSYIVNFSAVREISTSFIILSDGTQVPISRFYSEKTKQKFAIWAASEVI